jgi:plasmid stability protein
MEKMQIYLPREELEALRAAAARSGSSIAAVVRDAIRQVVLRPGKGAKRGPVAIWDGVPKRSSTEHDSIYDEA